MTQMTIIYQSYITYIFTGKKITLNLFIFITYYLFTINLLLKQNTTEQFLILQLVQNTKLWNDEKKLDTREKVCRKRHRKHVQT